MMTKGGPKSHKIDDVFYEWPQKGKTRYHLLMTKKSSKVFWSVFVMKKILLPRYVLCTIQKPNQFCLSKYSWKYVDDPLWIPNKSNYDQSLSL